MSLEKRVEIRLEFQAGMAEAQKWESTYVIEGPQRLQLCWHLKEQWEIKLERGNSLLEYFSYSAESLGVGTSWVSGTVESALHTGFGQILSRFL